MIKRFFKEYGILLLFFAAVVAAFMLGFVFGMYGRSAPSLEVAERYESTIKEEVSPVPVSLPVESAESFESIVEVVETAETVEPEVLEVAEISETYHSKSLGIFKLTAYCPCAHCSGGWGKQTSTGTTATAGRTIAVDPSVIPYGTEVVINGISYIAEDTGGAIKGNKIDIFFDSHEEAESQGVQYAEVFLK